MFASIKKEIRNKNLFQCVNVLVFLKFVIILNCFDFWYHCKRENSTLLIVLVKKNSNYRRLACTASAKNGLRGEENERPLKSTMEK